MDTWWHMWWKRIRGKWIPLKTNKHQLCSLESICKTMWKHVRINTYNKYIHAGDASEVDARYRILGTCCCTSSAKRPMHKIIEYFLDDIRLPHRPTHQHHAQCIIHLTRWIWMITYAMETYRGQWIPLKTNKHQRLQIGTNKRMWTFVRLNTYQCVSTCTLMTNWVWTHNVEY